MKGINTKKCTIILCFVILVKKSRATKRPRGVPAGLVALGEQSTIVEEEAVAPVQNSITSPYFSQPGNGTTPVLKPGNGTALVPVKEEKGGDSPDVEQIPSAKNKARKKKQQAGSRKRKRTALEEPGIALKVEVLIL